MGVRYRLNTLLAWFPGDPSIALGRQPYRDQSHLKELRERHRETHLVRRSREGIEAIGYLADAELVGAPQTVCLATRPDITQHLLKEWLGRSLINDGLQIRWGRTLEYISERPEDNLLTVGLGRGMRLPDGVGCWIAADFDVRRIRGTSGQMRPVVVIDVRTRITIDCPLSELLGVGLDVRGLYIQHEVQTPQGPRRRLAGRVRAITGHELILDDYAPDVPTVPIATARLEPRKDNLERVVRAIAGPNSTEVLQTLTVRTAERIGGQSRLALVDGWVKFIRESPPDVAQGISVGFDTGVLRADSRRFPPFEVYGKPRLVFDVGRTKTSAWNQGGLDQFGPYNFERFSPKRLNVAIVCQASCQGEVEHFVHLLLDGIPGSKYAATGFVRRFHLERPALRTFTCRSPSAKHYREAVGAAIDEATSRNERWNLALIQIDEIFHQLTGDENPYLVTKALFLGQQVPTQAFELESIRQQGQVDTIANNIGLAAYAKVNGIPWLLPAYQTVAHELVVGLGSFEASESRLGGRERYIGVTTVFSSDGRYLLESRTPATPADEYLPALLAALERVVAEVRRQNAWTDDQPIRFVFHVFKDFNQTEITAVKDLMARLRLPHVDFAFLHLVENHPFMLFDPEQHGVGVRTKKGTAAAPRGLRVDLANNEALVCLKGPKELRQGTDGLPRPLLLRLHRDSTFKDLTYLARQVYDFSCLSWRTLLPSPLPITVLYSDLVARNLLQLRDVKGWSPEHILGPIGRSRWFL